LGDSVLFKYNIANNSYEVKYDFNDIGFSFSHVTGVNPFGGLIKASNGLLYGTTELGGIDNSGVLFTYNTTTETYTKIFNFLVDNMRGFAQREICLKYHQANFMKHFQVEVIMALELFSNTI